MTTPSSDRQDPVVGFFLAAIVASFVCAISFNTGDFVRSQMDFEEATQGILGMTLYGSFITAATAWPGFALTLYISRKLDHRSLPFFIFFGIATAYSAVFVAAFLFGKGMFALMHELGLYAGGAAGGLAYGLLASPKSNKRHTKP
ncbi:MAG: hypothetical protein ABJQ71_15795 [Roseibium sp.]|uniref:hypothetical protein n=1 Tax=Roseibium polysiphoniae TaxID=2571221 RepID=UPI0032995285